MLYCSSWVSLGQIEISGTKVYAHIRRNAGAATGRAAPKLARAAPLHDRGLRGRCRNTGADRHRAGCLRIGESDALAGPGWRLPGCSRNTGADWLRMALGGPPPNWRGRRPCMIEHAFRGWGRNLGPTSTGRAAPKLARVAALHGRDFRGCCRTTGAKRHRAACLRMGESDALAGWRLPGTQD